MELVSTKHKGAEAKLIYLPSDIQLISPGNYVRCAITGNAIPLEMLRYWNVERQEPYESAEVSHLAHSEAKHSHLDESN